MKLRVAYFAFASVWHSVLGQEQSTFLRGSGVEGAVAEEDKRAPFGGIFNSHEHQPPSLFEDDREGVITEIVGGVPVDPREYKFFVWLNGCGASLVAPNVVLSAAHCFGVSNVVTLGMHKINLGTGEAAEFYNIEHIPIAQALVHHKYNKGNLDYDILLIQLQWASRLYAGNLAQLDTPTDSLVLANTSGADLVVVGFGTLTSGGVTPNVMQEVVVDYLSNAACVSQPYGYSSSDITSSMMCAGRSGKDSCQGDSGGPILDVISKKQVGVVSWGFGCADPVYPGVYSRISAAYTDFIGPYISYWQNQADYNTPPANSYAVPTSSTWTEHILGCTDLGGFYDSDGVEFNCMWYAGSENGAPRCSLYGNNFAHAGLTANMACCVCGGGMKSPMTSAPTTQKPTSKPSTRKPTTMTSFKPTTRKPTLTSGGSAKPTTRKPTSKPTQIPTNEPTTDSPTTNSPTTDFPTTDFPTTDSPTTDSPTTDLPTTNSPTTTKPTTHKPTTKPTTRKPTSKPTTRPIIGTTDVVSDWSMMLLAAVRSTSASPPFASRAMAMVHVAIFEAINGIANVFEPYHVIDKPKFNASTVAAAATAAHKVLVALFPTQVEEFDAQLMTSLAGIPTNPLTSGREWGTVCANDVLTMRSNDNSALESTPQPTNQLPGFWIPTEPVFRPPLLPNWPLVKPFTLSSGSSLRPEVLPALTSEEYTIAFNEVKNLGRKTSTLRTEEQSQIALFWADSAGTETPPGHWLRIAMEVAMARGLSTLERARLCALLGMGLADAAIVAWDAKYAFNHWRPITGIRAASTDGNPGTDEDVSWSPLIPTPPFPAFTSGHSTFSATAARIIARVLGSDNIAFETTSQGLPNITRSFASFSAAAAEAGQSRIYGGIHWQYDNQNALAKGIQLGDHIIDRFLKPIGELNTTTSIPTTTKPTTRNPTSKPTTRVPTAKPTTRTPI